MMMMEAAFFDLDKTIIARSSALVFGRPFYKEGLISRSHIVKGMYAQLVYHLVGADENKMERMRAALLELTKGWDKARVSELVRECIREKFGEKLTLDKTALARRVAGIWKNRRDLGSTDKYVRRLRKDTRRARLKIG